MNILTFDVEEWFHLLDNASTKTEKEWNNYEPRIHNNIQRIFDMLDKHNQKATFFCMGWMAERFPEVIREIVDRGYEIGSHTHLHQLAYEQTPKEFRADVDRSVKTLEDISGKKVRCFRAPGFSIVEKNLWAFETLADLGIEIDSSVFPAPRMHGGLPNFSPAQPTLIEYAGKCIKEFPINTFKLLGKNVIFSGGGYFRIFPYHLLKRYTSKSDYVMSYLHPRDFDAKQPVIQELSLERRFRSYVGLKGAMPKLDRWLSDFDFVDLAEADSLVDWEIAKTIVFDV